MVLGEDNIELMLKQDIIVHLINCKQYFPGDILNDISLAIF